MDRGARHSTAARSSLAVLVLLTLVLGPLAPRPREVAAAPAPAPLAATTWYTETVDPGSGQGQFASLAIDSSDHLHVSYYDAPNTALRYAGFNGTAWAPVTIDNSGSVGQYTSIGLDPDGHPHVSYYESEAGLRHAVLSGKSWSTEPVDYSNDVGEYSSLGVDAYGNVHISYYDAVNSALKYARLSGGTWVSQTLDANTGSWQFTSLDLTRYPHIVYYAPGTNQLKYIEGTLSGWSTAKSPVNAIGEGGRYVSLALDSGGSPHISYFDGTGVVYTYWDPARARWYDQTVATIGSESTVHTAIALDDADGVHLAYADDLGTGHLVYAHLDGITWLTETVEDMGHPAYPSIAIDSQGYPHIAYQNDAGLRHAWMAATPDLVVTDVWLDGSGQIAYQVQNVGAGAAPAGHQTTLSLDSHPGGADFVNVSLGPGERYNGTLAAWGCTGTGHTLRVTADGGSALVEASDSNNAREETWLCDTEPPAITSGPTATPLSTTSASVGWTTDEAADSRVRYGTEADGYPDTAYNGLDVTSHALILSGLTGGTVYHYVVESVDPSGNMVVSDEGFFETPAPAVSPPAPTIDVVRRSGDYPAYDVLVTFPSSGKLAATGAQASAPGVERVGVYVDDVLVGTDYTPSLVSGGLTKYEVAISPAALGWNRDLYFVDPTETPHELTVAVFDHAGNLAEIVRQFGPVREEIPVDIALWTPFDDTTYETDETGVLPDGKTIQIAAEAIQYEWECEYVSFRGSDPYAMPPNCRDVEHQVSSVGFYVDGNLVGTSTTPVADYTHVVQWDASGLGIGDYLVQAVAVATDGSLHPSEVRTIHVVEGAPALSVDRTVTRHGNYFQVDLVLSLAPDAAGPAYLKELVDYADELVPVETETTAYATDIEYSLWLGTAERRSRITVDFGSGGNDWIYLAPGNSHTVSYKVVPTLYDDGEANPRLGAFDTEVTYLYEGDTYTTSYDRFWQNLPSVNAALNTADYILVTNPHELSELFGDADTGNLLSSMARLATIRNGVLGLIETYAGSDQALRELTQPGGYWAEALNPAFSTTLGGYMLIVGETEIVPAFNTYNMDVCWDIEDDWFYCDATDNDVIAHDQWYSSTSGDGAPELIVGRIVGNAAWQLDRAMIVSNGIYEGQSGFEYQAPGRALLVAGSKDNASTFADNIHTVEMILNNGGDDDWLVEQLILPSSYPWLALETGMSHGVSLLHLIGHGSALGFEDALSTGMVPDLYGFSPFVFAASCLTGKYEGPSDSSLVEAMFNKGISAYIGAVQVSSVPLNDEMSADFYVHNWEWETGESLGHAFAQLERDFYEEPVVGYDYQRFWVDEYNFYGDPKLGASAPPQGGLAAQSVAAAPVTSLHVQVPAYVVSTTVDGFDEVTIPGGRLLQDVRQPVVPYWTVSVDYAPGVRVQDVTLTGRSGGTTLTGLTLPTTAMTYDADPLPDASVLKPIDLIEDDEWYPALDEIYEWDVVENPDGSSELHVQVFPFHTQLATTNAEWYDDFTFAVDVITSAVAIDALQVAGGPYNPGDDVDADVWLAKTGPAQDVIVAAAVRSAVTGEVAQGLPLQSLHDLEGPAKTSVVWDTSGIAPGPFLLWIDLYDTAGNWLDSASELVEIGTPQAEVSLTATPAVFSPGDAVDITVALGNTGAVTVTGDLIVQVQTADGLTVTAAYTHTVTSLAPGHQIVLEDVWQTGGVARGDYRVISYAKYASRTSGVESVALTTERRVYLPLLLRASP